MPRGNWSSTLRPIRARNHTPARAEFAAAEVGSGWRERALNAESALATADTEIRQQRDRIGELMGQIRDLEQAWSLDGQQHLASENTTLRQRLRQLTEDNAGLTKRLAAARSNNRFIDHRIADLETRLLDESQLRTALTATARPEEPANPGSVRWWSRSSSARIFVIVTVNRVSVADNSRTSTSSAVTLPASPSVTVRDHCNRKTSDSMPSCSANAAESTAARSSSFPGSLLPIAITTSRLR